MTIIVVILIGAGIILIASALDNSSIGDTFRKIINGNQIDWTGQGKKVDSNTEEKAIRKV